MKVKQLKKFLSGMPDNFDVHITQDWETDHGNGTRIWKVAKVETIHKEYNVDGSCKTLKGLFICIPSKWGKP